MKKFGILVPVVTPCDQQGQVDTQGLISVCNEMTGLGCKGIFALGSTGRGPWFDRRDRIKICKAAVSAKKEDTTIFAGVMASGLNDMLENAKAMADAGADIAVMTAPGYFEYSQDEIKNIFLRFIDQSPLPVLVYDIPDFTGVKLDEGLISDLVQHENVVGIKDSSGDRERFFIPAGPLQGPDDLLCVPGQGDFIGGKHAFRRLRLCGQPDPNRPPPLSGCGNTPRRATRKRSMKFSPTSAACRTASPNV